MTLLNNIKMSTECPLRADFEAVICRYIELALIDTHRANRGERERVGEALKPLASIKRLKKSQLLGQKASIF